MLQKIQKTQKQIKNENTTQINRIAELARRQRQV